MFVASAADVTRKNPTTGFRGCCAEATLGPASTAALPSAMTSRRLMFPPRRWHRSCSNQRFDRGWSGPFALHQERLGEVRFGSLGDIAALSRNVRFTPNSDTK